MKTLITILSLTLLTPTIAHAGQQPLTKTIAKQAVTAVMKVHYAFPTGTVSTCNKILKTSRKTTCSVTYYNGDDEYRGKINLILVRNDAGIFTRGRGTFTGKWTSDNPSCKPCSGKTKWSEKLSLIDAPTTGTEDPETPIETPVTTPTEVTNNPTPEQQAQNTIDKSIIQLIIECKSHPKINYCHLSSFESYSAGGLKVPRYIVKAVDAQYVSHTATPAQSELLSCWLSWKPDGDLGTEGGWTDYTPPACTNTLLTDHPELLA